jgi:ADP-L-glycero-D-manno-heptose 6-epimerase
MSFVIGSTGFIGSHMTAIGAPGLICMAGISDTTCEDERLLKAVNVDLPLQLAYDAQAAGLPFVYASSASVYGNGEGPINAYARSKAELDRQMLNRFVGENWWYGLRFFNVYGPGEAQKLGQASIVTRLLSGSLREVFAPHTERDFIHVSDCVDVVRWLLEIRPSSGIYDVGTGVARPISDVIALTQAKVRHVPMPAHLEGKYQFNTQAMIGGLRRDGYDKPFLTLEEGLERMG